MDDKHHIITCPNCDGKGYHFDTFGVFATAGIALLFGDKNYYRDKCTQCDGAGKVIKKLKVR